MGIKVEIDRRSEGGEIVSREERNSNSGLGFMLGNLAMGFDVYDARAQCGGGRRRYRRCFQIKRPFHGGPHRGFTTLSRASSWLLRTQNRSTWRHRNLETSKIMSEIMTERVPDIVISWQECCRIMYNNSSQNMKISIAFLFPSINTEKIYLIHNPK